MFWPRAAVPAVHAQIQPPLKVSVTGVSTNGLALEWSAGPTNQGYRVEYRNTLGSGAWLPCPLQDQWPQAGTHWTDPRGATAGPRFYRVMALQMVRGAVVTNNILTSYSILQLTAMFAFYGIQPTNAVDVYQVVYNTITPDGAPACASGALMLPHGVSQSLPLLSCQHGTEVLTNEVPSQGNGEFTLGLLFASIGYVTALPDYLGMGAGSGLHPYIHARSEATAVVDLLRAGRLLCAQTGVALNGQLFLIGYSQGGQATMAAHREIETWHTNEFTVTASAPMAGPYDMSGTMANLMTANQPYDSPFYLPYTLFSYNSVYRLYDAVSQALVPPYDTTLPPMFDGLHSDSQINAVMPPVPSQILRSDYLQAFLADSNHPLRVVLRANDLYNWKPKAPMHLYHCHGDTTVPYANSEIAYTHFQANGAAQVVLYDPYPAGNHSTGAFYCYQAAKFWFDTLKH